MHLCFSRPSTCYLTRKNFDKPFEVDDNDEHKILEDEIKMMVLGEEVNNRSADFYTVPLSMTINQNEYFIFSITYCQEKSCDDGDVSSEKFLLITPKEQTSNSKCNIVSNHSNKERQTSAISDIEVTAPISEHSEMIEMRCTKITEGMQNRVSNIDNAKECKISEVVYPQIVPNSEDDEPMINSSLNRNIQRIRSHRSQSKKKKGASRQIVSTIVKIAKINRKILEQLQNYGFINLTNFPKFFSFLSNPRMSNNAVSYMQKDSDSEATNYTASLGERFMSASGKLKCKSSFGSFLKAKTNHQGPNGNDVNKTYLCIYCPATFKYKSELQRHLRVHTRENPFSCEICQKRFSRKSNLSRHLLVHTGEKPFSCKICQRKFSKRSNLSVHIRVHTGEKPFSCEICQRKFLTKNNLSKHLRVHTGEKPFSCEICQKKFSDTSTLSRHLRVHTGEKPFSCDICQKKFSDTSTLSRHLRVHTGEKPFFCKICQKNFSQKSTLSKHLRVHTREKPFSCEICKKKFSWKSTLTQHLKARLHEALKHA